MSNQRPSPGEAREHLTAWRQAYPSDPYATDLHLDLVNARYLSGTRLANIRALGSQYGELVTKEIGPLVAAYEAHPPELVKYDGLGTQVEEVRFDAGYHEAGRLVWESGMLQLAGRSGSSFEQANLAYLTALEGEMGHMCAATCTTGLIRVLRRAASDDVRDRYLPALTNPIYARASRGAQFLTEVQGGSDVGANAATARPAGDGTFRVHGEKWFCSVVDADLFLVLARPDGAVSGTQGLGCFLIPRLVDGRVNGFSIRRLKDKLGTTSMASGEVDFDGAVALPIGAVDQGFKIMVTAMLNSSRWLNAVGNLGMMRRAYVEASAYAVHREAFGVPIGSFPLVRGQLATMKAEWLAALYSTWYLTSLDEQVDLAIASGVTPESGVEEMHRFLVNANKLTTSVAATDVVRSGIELLGGNGAIESFSVLPRLLRDCVVFEQWEGTHNVLTAQVLRDLGRLGLGGVVIERIARGLKGIAAPDLGATAGRATRAAEELAVAISRSVDDPHHGSLHFRSHLERLVRVLQVTLMLEAAETAPDPLRGELAATAELLTGDRLDSSYRAADDPGRSRLIDRVIGADAGAVG